MSGIVLAIISGISYAMTNITVGALTKRYSTLVALFYRCIFTTTILSILTVFIFKEAKLDWQYILIGFFLASMGYIGLYFLYKAFSVGKIGVVSPITNTSGVISAIIAVTILHEKVTQNLVIGSLIIITGIFITTVSLKDWKNSDLFKLKSGVPYAILTSLIWGVVFVFYKYPAIALGSIFFSLIIETTNLVWVCLQVRATETNLPILTKNNLLIAILSGLTGVGGIVCQNLYLSKGHISITQPIAGATLPVANLIFAFVFLKEKLSTKQYIGCTVAILGIVVLAIQ